MRLLRPCEVAPSLSAIDFAGLFREGKRAILFDLDNTLGTRRPKSLSPDTVALLEGLEEMGFRIGILTNRRRVEDDAVMHGLARRYPVEHGAGKPWRRGFVALLARLEVPPDAAVMVGDRLLTDILGANRLGIHSIRVRAAPPKPGVDSATPRGGGVGRGLRQR